MVERALKKAANNPELAFIVKKLTGVPAELDDEIAEKVRRVALSLPLVQPFVIPSMQPSQSFMYSLAQHYFSLFYSRFRMPVPGAPEPPLHLIFASTLFPLSS